MDKSVYDTREGIASELGTYDDLYALFRARHAAGYDRRELLNEFVILGRFCTDRCGNWWTMRFEKPLPPEVRSSLQPVMTRDEFHAALGPDARYGCGSSTGPLGSLPPPQMLCARCGTGGWTVENCHAFEAEDDSVLVPLDPFLGKTLAEVQDALQSRTDGIYNLHASVRNDRWKDPRGRLGREEGWRHDQDKDDPIGMDYVVAPGDDGGAFVLRFYHEACRGDLRGEEQAAQKAATIEGVTLMFRETGFGNVRVEPIPLPQHIIDWMKQDGEDEPDLEAASKELTYLKVSTDQGTLGVFIAAYPTLDLTGTGISISEIAPEMAEAPPDTPAICGFDGNPATLLKIWQLLVKQKEKTPA